MSLRISYGNLDNKTFEQLFIDHFDPLCRFASGYVKDSDSAREIVQEVFINLWQKKDTLDPAKSLKSYLFTSVKNRCLNYIRDNKKFRSYYLDVEIEIELPVTDKDTFTENEIKSKIAGALDQLPPKCREVFELSRFEGMRYKEIADKIGISVKTVEVQVSKALKILRHELKEFLVILLLLWFR